MIVMRSREIVIVIFVLLWAFTFGCIYFTVKTNRETAQLYSQINRDLADIQNNLDRMQ